MDENPEQVLEAMRERAKNDPRLRLAVALHEAGHVLYARRVGATEMRYHGAREYPGRPGEYGEAGVEPFFAVAVRIELREMARWYCAGSVVKRLLCPDYWEDGEDATDYDVFAEQSRSLAGANPDEIAETWKAAQQDVERDLRSPAFRRELWALAREVESKIPW